jgi:hypothetical protein
MAHTCRWDDETVEIDIGGIVERISMDELGKLPDETQRLMLLGQIMKKQTSISQKHKKMLDVLEHKGKLELGDLEMALAISSATGLTTNSTIAHGNSSSLVSIHRSARDCCAKPASGTATSPKMAKRSLGLSLRGCWANQRKEASDGNKV